MKMQETKHESDPEIKSTFKADINQFGSCEKDSDCDKKCFPSCQLTKCSIRHTCECSDGTLELLTGPLPPSSPSPLQRLRTSQLSDYISFRGSSYMKH
ncbi:hypothetical protein HID58_007190, partial [Brassica napus]